MHQICEEDVAPVHRYVTCPFCLNQYFEPGHDRIRCPACDAHAEAEDRIEDVYLDGDITRFPSFGLICATCGLIQAGKNQNCLYCGTRIKETAQ